MYRVIIGLSIAWLASVPILADDQPQVTVVEPQAKELLDQVVLAYRDLDAYSDEGVFTTNIGIGGVQASHEQPMALAIARPNRFSIDAGGVRLVSDGEFQLSVIEPTRSYLSDRASERINAATITEGPLGAMLLGGPGGVPATIVVHLLLSENPAERILEGGVGLRLAPEAELDGSPVLTLLVDSGVGPNYLLRIDPATKLLRRIDVTIEGDSGLKDSFADAKPGEVRLSWAAGQVSTSMPEPGAFSVEPPADFVEVKPLRADP